MGVRDDATLGEHSRPAAMDDSHRVTGNTDRLVHSEGGGEVLIGGNVRELRLWGNRGGGGARIICTGSRLLYNLAPVKRTS